MKKTLYFIPAILFAVFYLWLSIRASVGSIDWGFAVLFTSPFIIAGVVLAKRVFWGGFIGMLPAVYLISLGKHTYLGIEFPLGIILFVYYAICSVIVYKVYSVKAGE